MKIGTFFYRRYEETMALVAAAEASRICMMSIYQPSDANKPSSGRLAADGGISTSLPHFITPELALKLISGVPSAVVQVRLESQKLLRFQRKLRPSGKLSVALPVQPRFSVGAGRPPYLA